MVDIMSAADSWAVPLPWVDIQRGAAPMHLVAEPEVLMRVARAIGARAVTRLEADLIVRPWLDGVEISGAITAEVTRICGVSLDAFDETIEEPLSIRIVPAGSPNAPQVQGKELAIDPQADDPPDELTGDSVDIGAYVVEHLALALSPFPRKPGVVFEAPDAPTRPSAFAELARLREPPTGD
jgi:hypothetical protein